MANSLIEDVMNEQQPINNGKNQEKKSKNKKSKKAIVVILILLLIIIICACVALYMLSNQDTTISAKQGFFEAVTKNNIEQVSDLSTYEQFISDMLSESSSVETTVNISDSSYDSYLNNLEIVINSQNDIENTRTYSDITLNYSDNELFNFEILATNENLALKSDEVVTNFVGASYEWIQENLLTTSTTSDFDTETEIVTSITDEVGTSISNEDITISDESLQGYVDILNNNLDESQFTSSEVTLSMDSGIVDCTEYTLTMTEEQFYDIFIQILEEFETDADTIEAFSSVLSLVGYSESDLIDVVDAMISNIEGARNLNSTSDESSNVVIKVYDNNGQTVKLSIQDSVFTMEIEYVYGDNSSSIKLTAVEDDSGNGASCKITNSTSDLTQSVDLDISVIENNSVEQTVTIETEVVKSGSDYTFNLNVNYQDSEESFDIETVSDIEFVEVDVEELTTDNCVFLDELSEEEQDETLNLISERLQTVLLEKIAQLAFIDTNTNTTYIDQNDDTEEDTDDEKELAKQDLITAIQNEMTEAINNEEEYTIQDLEGLEVEGHTVEVELSDDLAVVTVDGYTFNIDSEFNLSE